MFDDHRAHVTLRHSTPFLLDFIASLLQAFHLTGGAYAPYIEELLVREGRVDQPA